MLLYWHQAVNTMLYESTKLRQPILIKRIYTIHFYEYDSAFQFEGEAHDFWELVYVDRGLAVITHGEEEICLEQGFALLHRPGIFHTVKAAGSSGLNLLVISFDCSAAQLELLTESPFAILSADKQRLSSILSEARRAFSSPLDGSYFKLRRRDTAPFAGEQLIALDLQALLIHLLRRKELPQEIAAAGNDLSDQAAEDQLAQAISHMQQNLKEPLSVEEICRRCLVSRSKLQRLFRQGTKQSALNYYISLRVDAAKEMMRSHQHSYSEIADELGFGSIHYFSKQFKQVTGMTPTEYSASLRSLTDRKSC